MTKQMKILEIDSYLDQLFELSERGIDTMIIEFRDHGEMTVVIEDIIDFILELQAEGYEYFTLVIVDNDGENIIGVMPVPKDIQQPYIIDPEQICPN